MLKNIFAETNQRIETILGNCRFFLEQNTIYILGFVIVIIAGYGFELFNFNITIDEEVASFHTVANISWISQGRWGMYILNSLFAPSPIIPFMPLFMALVFHTIAIIITTKTLKLDGKISQWLVATLCVCYPGIAFVYTFSTLSYGVGVGFFLCALSLYIFFSQAGKKKFFAVLPIAFAFAIYQGLLIAAAALFLLYVIFDWNNLKEKFISVSFSIIAVFLLAVITYFVVQNLIFWIGNVPSSNYTDQYFDISYLFNNFYTVVKKLSQIILQVYTGAPEIYGEAIPLFGVVMLCFLASHLFNVFTQDITPVNKIVITILTAIFIALPFLSGLVTRGFLAMRFLVALPFTISGIAILGFRNRSLPLRALLGFLTILCVFQFLNSSNHLFGASNLALQEDRALAAQLIMRIEEAKSEAKTENVEFIEVAGALTRPVTPLIPQIETFGASFFQWDQGNVNRMIYFLNTITPLNIKALPQENRYNQVATFLDMPTWPAIGSVKVVNNVVLVKFGPYSDLQTQVICENISVNSITDSLNFCP